MRYLLLSLCFTIGYNSQSEKLYSDTTRADSGLTDSLVFVDQFPEYKDGIEAFYQDVARAMEYPASARRMGIQGVVQVSFVVNRVGELEEVFAVKGISKLCDEQAVRAIQATSGKWIPGMHEGKLVKVRMVLPITFKIDEKGLDLTYNATDLIDGDTAFIVEEQPKYRGGVQKFYTDLGHFVKYPKSEKKAGIQGTVLVQFVVNKLGAIEDATVLEGISPKCDDSALKAIKKTSGNWIPGRHSNRNVKVRMVLPIIFSLN